MTHKKEKLLAALLTSRTKKEAAKAAGISERTMRTYFDDPEFRAAYKQAAAGIMDSTTRQLQQNLTAAIDRLGKIVEDDEESSITQVSAARTLLDYALRFTEFNDILKEMESTEGEAGCIMTD